MSDYMQGVLTFPAAVILTAAAVAAAFGAFLVLEKWWEGRIRHPRRADWDVHEGLGAAVARARRLVTARAFGWRLVISQDTPAVVTGGTEDCGSDREGIRHRRIAAAIADANTTFCRDYPGGDQ